MGSIINRLLLPNKSNLWDTLNGRNYQVQDWKYLLIASAIVIIIFKIFKHLIFRVKCNCPRWLLNFNDSDLSEDNENLNPTAIPSDYSASESESESVSGDEYNNDYNDY